MESRERRALHEKPRETAERTPPRQHTSLPLGHRLVEQDRDVQPDKRGKLLHFLDFGGSAMLLGRGRLQTAALD